MSVESHSKHELCGNEKMQFLLMVQQIIARMSNCSITLKVCCATLVAGMFVFLSTGSSVLFPVRWLMLVPFALVILLFSWFDAKYLQQERCYRHLYGEMLGADNVDFDRSLKMPNPKRYGDTSICMCYLSWSVGGYYSVLFLGVVATFVVCMLCGIG